MSFSSCKISNLKTTVFRVFSYIVTQMFYFYNVMKYQFIYSTNNIPIILYVLYSFILLLLFLKKEI